MKIKKMKNKIDVENQFDIELQGCSDDCCEHYGKTSADRSLLESAGVDATDPSRSDIEEGVDLANTLGIEYCYRMHTPKSCIYF